MAAPASSMKAVIAALGANSFITVIKFIAFAFSGSGAMLSEAIHSLADAGNQALLLIGLRRARKDSDDEFHYGYGGERFIFGMLSASGIFFIGCGVTVYHGVDGLMHPHMPELHLFTWVVLGASLLIEGGSTAFAFKSVMAHRPKDYPMVRYLREKVDPAALAILLEDSAAIFGLFLAAIGIVLAYVTQNPMWDSIGSILVGVLLGYVAIHLVQENRGLLLGKAVPEGIGEKFEKILPQLPQRPRGLRREDPDADARGLQDEGGADPRREVLRREAGVRAALRPGRALRRGAGGHPAGAGGGGDRSGQRRDRRHRGRGPQGDPRGPAHQSGGRPDPGRGARQGPRWSEGPRSVGAGPQRAGNHAPRADVSSGLGPTVSSSSRQDGWTRHSRYVGYSARR